MDAIVSGKVGNINNGTVFSPLIVYKDIWYNKTQDFLIPSENANAVLIHYTGSNYINYKQVEIENFIQLNYSYTIALGYRHDVGDYTVSITQVTINYESSGSRRISLSSSYYLQNFIASVEIGTLE